MAVAKNSVQKLNFVLNRQEQPKAIKAVRVTGEHTVYKCVSSECKWAIHSKLSNGIFVVTEINEETATKGGTILPVSCVEHSAALCNNLGNIQPAVAALAFHQNSQLGPRKGDSVKEQARAIRLNNFNVGGHNRTASELTAAQRKAVTRTGVHLRALQVGDPTEMIKLLRSLVEVFPTINEGAHSGYENYEDGTFRRMYIIPQLAVSVWKTGFGCHFISVDGGFWKNAVGKEYKVLTVTVLTGNNKNVELIFCIADGETAENIVYMCNALGSAGIDINQRKVTTISDEGSGIWKAFRESIQEPLHMLCCQHWVGKDSVPNKWGAGKENYYNIIKARTQQGYDKAVSTSIKVRPANLPLQLTLAALLARLPAVRSMFPMLMAHHRHYHSIKRVESLQQNQDRH